MYLIRDEYMNYWYEGVKPYVRINKQQMNGT
jgi:hypothetical protein